MSDVGEDADAEALGQAFLDAAGGDAARACTALAHRVLWLSRQASRGLVRKPLADILNEDCEALTRETAFFAVPFSSEEEQV
jgi:hypothetical protein